MYISMCTILKHCLLQLIELQIFKQPVLILIGNPVRILLEIASLHHPVQFNSSIHALLEVVLTIQKGLNLATIALACSGPRGSDQRKLTKIRSLALVFDDSQGRSYVSENKDLCR